MKKDLIKVAFLIGLSTIIFSGCSSKEQANALPNQYTDLNKEKEYEDMKKKIIEENRDKWINEGFNKAKKILTNYASKIKSYEVGKYAMRKGYVTYPQIVAVEENGQVSVQNFGCEIKKELSIDEIMTIFANDGLQTSTVYNPSSASNNSTLNSNSSDVSAVGVDYTMGGNKTVQTTSELNNLIEKSFQNSFKNKEILDNYSVSYIRSGGELIASFKSDQEYSNFCQMTSICN